jgi:hypothetical protein
VEVCHFYHVWVDGVWPGPVREHVEALGAAGFPGPVTVGLVGYAGDRPRVRDLISARFADAGLPPPAGWVEADAGFEDVTLRALRDHASCGDAHILYAHTKGAYDDSPWNAAWRRSMTRHMVGGWEQCVKLLGGGYDTVGCHWLTPGQHHDPPDWDVPSPFYGGNFWWAAARYVRRLPPVPRLRHENRHDAERWVGLAGPRAYDLLPGWPSAELCAPP